MCPALPQGCADLPLCICQAFGQKFPSSPPPPPPPCLFHPRMSQRKVLHLGCHSMLSWGNISWVLLLMAYVAVDGFLGGAPVPQTTSSDRSSPAVGKAAGNKKHSGPSWELKTDLCMHSRSWGAKWAPIFEKPDNRTVARWASPWRRDKKNRTH